MAFLLLPDHSAGQNPLADKPALSLSPQQVLEEAAKVKRSDNEQVTILLDQRRVAIDANGKCDFTYHLVYRIETAEAVKGSGALSLQWEPWYQSQPKIKARVVTADGVEHLLDLSTMSDGPARKDTPDIYDDERVYHGPLPAVAVGAIIETDWQVTGTAPFFPGGSLQRLYVGRSISIQQMLLEVEAPASAPLRYETRLLKDAAVTREVRDGVVHLTLKQGPVAGNDEPFTNLPADVPDWPQMELSTVASWAQVNETYRQMSEPQVRVAEVKDLVAGVITPGDSRNERIRKLLARLHKEVRYTGIEFAQSKLTPQPPSETLKRKYGDCKDKASLMVAMLRAAGIPAHLALLKVGGQDVTESLPGMGLFNHAIVYVPAEKAGGADLWIDATDEFAAIDNLPSGDQKRLALIIREGTTGLVRIPGSTSTQNLMRETRQFELAEYGPAHIIETTETRGTVDSYYRSVWGHGETKDIRKNLESYVKSAYLAEDLTSLKLGDGADMTTPFRLQLEVARGRRGLTDLDSATVAIFLGGIVGRLPDYFSKTDDDEKKKFSKDKPKPERKDDFVLTHPFQTEWVYKIVPPPGFQLHALPENRTQSLGPANLTVEFSTGKDGVVNGVIRFDTVKDRYTAAEAKEIQKGVERLKKANAILVNFDQVGAALINAGKVREALAADRDLIKLHPQEGLHHAQLATALLEGGLGEKARVEAQRATTLDPKSVVAWQTLGWISEFDHIGRRLHKGWDPAAVAAAYRKAIELDAEDDDSRINLAISYEYNGRGDRYAPDSNLEEAIKLYRELKTRKSNWRYLDNNLDLDLLHAGHFAEVNDAVADLELTTERRAWAVAAVAAKDGAEAGLTRSLDLTGDEKSRAEVLNQAGLELLGLRRYPEAAALYEKASAAGGDAAMAQEVIEAIRGTHLWDTIQASDRDPAGTVMRLLVKVTSAPESSKDWLAMLTPDWSTRPEKDKDAVIKELADTGEYLRNRFSTSDVPRVARADLALSNLRLTPEGNDQIGYRVRLDGFGFEGWHFFLAPGKGPYRLVAPGGYIGEEVAQALLLLKRSDVKGARTWLDWAAEDLRPPDGKDPLAGAMLGHFWKKGQEADKAELMGIIAASLAEHEYGKPLLADLKKADQEARTPELKQRFDLALLSYYWFNDKWADAVPLGETLLKANPDSLTALRILAFSLLHLNRAAEADAVVRERLQRSPDDTTVAEFQSNLATVMGDMKRTADLLRPWVESGKATAGMLNSYAWATLYFMAPDKVTIEAAQRANRLTNSESYAILHTLACVYAETGNTKEARKLLLDAMNNANLDEPNEAIWYGLGRIAEDYGELDAAKAAYLELKPPEKDELGGGSTFELAQIGLRRIAAASKP